MATSEMGIVADIATVEAPASSSKSESVASRQRRFLDTAMARLKLVVEVESQLRADMMDDQKFADSDQWPEEAKKARREDGRPYLTINRIPQFLNLITNKARANRPAVQVAPVDSAGDPKTAEILQGMIRNIEYDSSADTAYSTGCEQQVIGGRGHWRLYPEYENEDSFDQVIRIRRIPDSLSVFIDPYWVEADASDARFAIIVDDVSKEDLRDDFGLDVVDGFDTYISNNRADAGLWNPQGKVRVAEYFYEEWIVENISEVALPGDRRTVLPSSRLPDADLMRVQGWRVVRSRDARRRVIRWAKFIPSAILEGDDEDNPRKSTQGRVFPSRYIPIVQVIGVETNINGRRNIKGMTRDAKDPARMYSFWASALTEVISLAPRAPYIGYAGQFKGHTAKWDTAHLKSYAYLEVEALGSAGNPLPLPQRQQFEPAIRSIVEAFQLADNDIKAVMGFYDASLGKTGPEQSGRAILARQQQGEIGNANYLDNLNRAIRHTGRIIVDMIPRVYTPSRILRITGEDGKTKNVALVNGVSPEDMDALRQREADPADTGVEGIYDINLGRYDVVINSAPASTSKRQEAVNALLSVIQAQPALFSVVGDILFRNMDWAGAAEIAERLKPKEGDGGIPPELQQAMEKLQAENAELKKVIEARMVESQSKERIAGMGIAADRQTEALKAHMTELVARLKLASDKELTLIRADVKMAHDEMQRMYNTGQSERDRIDNERQRQLDLAIHASTIDHEAMQSDKDRATTLEQERIAATAPPSGSTE